MNIQYGKLFFAVSLMALTLSGCSFGVVADAEKDIQRTRNDTSDLVQTSVQPLPKADVSSVRAHNDVWLGSTAKRRNNGEPLPRAYEREGVTLVNSEALDLRGIADFISDELDIPTYLDPDVFGENGASMQQQQPQDNNGDGGSSPMIPPIEEMGGGDMFGGDIFAQINEMPLDFSSSSSGLRVNHEGKLSTFLNRVSAKFDVGWEYKDGDIRFYKNQTRTFMVKALPSTNTMGMTIDSNSGEGNSSANMSSGTEVSVNMWEELGSGFAEIVAGNGRINVAPSTGTVTISAPPSTMDRLDRYIKNQNDRFSKQVAISVRVLNVNLTDTDDYALNFSAVVENLAKDSSLGLMSGGSISGDVSDGLGVSWSILGGPDSPGGGASGLINAFSEKGDVSIVTSASATTLNNIPTPLQVGSTRDYVSEIGVERDDSGTTVDISTDSVSYGFNMQLLPRVVNDGRLLLQYNISQSELAGSVDGFDVFEWEDQRIQLANINNRSFSQQVEIPNGSTLALSGFEQSRSSVSKRGTGTPENMLLGGGQRGAMEREMMVILISPVILDAGKAIVEL